MRLASVGPFNLSLPGILHISQLFADSLHDVFGALGWNSTS